MTRIFCSTLDQLRQTSISGLDNLDEAYIGQLRSLFVWVNNEGGQDDNQTVIIPSSNPPSGRWICPSAPSIPNQSIPWSNVDKTGSSLSDLALRSATDIADGTLYKGRLPDGIPYFDNKPGSLILTTDSDGNYQLSKISFNQLTGLIPFAKIDWTMFSPKMIGAESTIYFNPNQFNVDMENNVTIKVMTDDSSGLAIPGNGILTNQAGSIIVDFGTGPSQVLEGPTPLGGDLSGEHTAAVVDALRNVPLTFNFNDLSGLDGYVLRLDAKNASTPFFYLSPESNSGGGGSDLPILDGPGALLTDGSKLYWGLIPESFIIPNFAITGFSVSPSQLEIGQSIANPTFTASYNGAISHALLSDSFGHNDSLISSTTSFQSKYTFTENVTFTLTVTSSADNTQHTASCNISWLTKVFYGHIPAQIDNVILIESLQTSELASTFKRTFTVVAGQADYIFYAFPTQMGSPSFSVGGFVGGFSLIATGVMIVNSYGVSLSYDIWRSDNVGLGSTTVSVN